MCTEFYLHKWTNITNEILQATNCRLSYISLRNNDRFENEMNELFYRLPITWLPYLKKNSKILEKSIFFN